MKTPGWAVFVGIMMILVGGCGALSDGQAIISPKLFSMNDEFLEALEDGSLSDTPDTLVLKSEGDIEDNHTDSINVSNGSIHVDEDDEIPKEIKELLKISDHYKTWVIRFGYIGFFFSFIYILSGFFMIVRQRFSLKLVYWTLGLCILFGLIQIFVFTMGEKNIFTLGSSTSAAGGIFFDILFLIIITACDTTAYEPQSFT